MARTPRPPPATAAVEAPAVWTHVDALNPWEKNPRDIAKAVPGVVRSILRWGFPTALTVDDATGLLVAGHTRTSALKVILRGGVKVVLNDGTPLKPNAKFTLHGAPGPGFVPVRRHRFASAREAQAYALADNRLSELADWNNDLLTEVVAGILAGDDDTHRELMHDAGFADDDPIMAGVIADMLRDDAPPPSTDGPHIPTGTHTGAGQGAAPDQSGDVGQAFRVLIDCGADEDLQRAVLALCLEKGWPCRALI